MKQYKNVLFDWDGCLAMSVDVWVESARQILDREGLQVTDQQIFAVFGKQGVMTYFPVANPEACQAELIKQAGLKLRQLRLYKGAKNCLQTLRRQGKTITIVSDCRREILEAGLAHNGLLKYFDEIITRGDAAHRKPHPAGINLALAALDANPENSIMVGDTEKDLLAAKNAGIDSVLFYPSAHTRLYDAASLQAYSPTYRVCSHAEVAELLR